MEPSKNKFTQSKKTKANIALFLLSALMIYLKATYMLKARMSGQEISSFDWFMLLVWIVLLIYFLVIIGKVFLRLKKSSSG